MPKIMHLRKKRNLFHEIEKFGKYQYIFLFQEILFPDIKYSTSIRQCLVFSEQFIVYSKIQLMFHAQINSQYIGNQPKSPHEHAKPTEVLFGFNTSFPISPYRPNRVYCHQYDCHQPRNTM